LQTNNLTDIPQIIFWFAEIIPSCHRRGNEINYAAACCYGTLALINTAYSLLTHRQGIGPGDWKLAAVIGAWLGLENLIIDLIVAFVLAA
jgi:prepilin signal peptidase PulO-like enzyme (type II secretory pathway)